MEREKYRNYQGAARFYFEASTASQTMNLCMKARAKNLHMIFLINYPHTYVVLILVIEREISEKVRENKFSEK